MERKWSEVGRNGRLAVTISDGVKCYTISWSAVRDTHTDSVREMSDVEGEDVFTYVEEAAVGVHVHFHRQTLLWGARESVKI